MNEITSKVTPCKKISTRCCIVGGGPAGIMLGFLLARNGIETTVLEKWPDFFRDFRGDTIHPSVLELLFQLNLLDEFLKLPHNQTAKLSAEIGLDKITIADFSHLKVHCPFIAFIPQWDFLNFITSKASQLSTFTLLMETEATDLIQEQGRVVGVKAKNAENEIEIRSEIVIGADGRHSTVREKSQLKVENLGAPMDVLWFRLPRIATDPKHTLGKIDMGKILIMIERGDYWQCGFLIRKGDFDVLKNKGIQAFHQNILTVLPMFGQRVNDITSWDQVKLLSVTVDHLEKWYQPGLLCIGDSAHAMSPIGGVGINLAIQDAVAAANILSPAFLENTITDETLAKVQKRRELPTKIIQKIQVFIQNRVIDRVLGSAQHPKVPFVFKMLQWIPYLQRIPAYMIGIGIRPEKINIKKNTPE